MEDTTLQEAHPEANADGSQGTGSTSERQLDPAEMQKTLSKQFNTINEMKQQLDALKAQPATITSDERIDALQSQLTQAEFYREHPELKEYKDILGSDPSVTIQHPKVKELLDKAIAHDQLENSKSVLQSNPRLGQVQDSMKQAREAASVGDTNTARESAVSAVLSAYDMK